MKKKTFEEKSKSRAASETWMQFSTKITPDNFICLYHQQKGFMSKVGLKQCHSYCKRVLECTELAYANKVVGNLSF